MILDGPPQLSGSPGPQLSPVTVPCSTKQLLADIMQFQPGDCLQDMLSLPASREQVSGQASPQVPLSPDTHWLRAALAVGPRGAPSCSPLKHNTSLDAGRGAVGCRLVLP